MRRAFTIAELVVALTLGGVAFGAFALLLARQERVHADLSHRIRARAGANEGIATLVVDLRAAAPGTGDIAQGTAADSAIELRATVATLSVCELRERTIITTPVSFLSAPKAGDSVWAYVAGDSAPAWTPVSVSSALPLPADDSVACPRGPAARDRATRGRDRPRYALEAAELPSLPLPPGTPLRLTRRTRYSLYRAPDGRWYFGRREFSSTLGRFETIQPVSGPYRSYAPVSEASSGLELRYFDRVGAELPSAALETHRIAKVEITMRTPGPPGDRDLRERRDVTTVTVALGGRP